LLDPAALRARLEQRLPVLASHTRDLPERQRTLRATIEWSYGLLDPDEQQAFRRLAVFAGGGTLEAVTEVTGADLDLVESLVDKSLLRRAGDRLSLLETIRELALEKLRESGEEAELRDRHASWYSGPVDEAKRASLAWGTDPDTWEWFRNEQENLRAAIAWLLEAGKHDAAVPLVSGCANYWLRTGSWTESERLLQEILSQAKSPRSRSSALFDLANIRWRRGAIDEARDLAVEALAIAEDDPEPAVERRAKHLLAIVAFQSGDLDSARAQWTEAVAGARAAGDELWVAMTLSNLGNLELDARDLAAARAHLEENVATARRLGFKYFVANNSIDLGMISLLERDYDRASSNLRESLDAVEEMGFSAELLVWNLTGVAAVALFHQDREVAGLLLGAVGRLSDDLGVDRDTYKVAGEIEAWTLDELHQEVENEEVAVLLARGRTLSRRDSVALARQVLG
jgi:tetratricopeptide (TPR) repeat protein